uniref:DUF1279 domain-containing protein n=1 Tax=Parastrongyloides trichosuri TaxID=131310 RepID=A0A0N4Z0U7_PARTI
MFITRCLLSVPNISKPLIRCQNISLLRKINYSYNLSLVRRCISTTPQNLRIGFSLDEDTRNKKLKGIIKERIEQPPTTPGAKLKYYIKRYWYIAIPVYATVYLSFLIGFYFLVKSGVDIVALMEKLHLPTVVIEKVKNSPPETSALVTAFLLNKLCGPIRLVAVLGGIQGTFKVLKHFNLLKTAKEVEFKVRSDYSIKKKSYKLRYGTAKKVLNKKLEKFKEFKNFKKK